MIKMTRGTYSLRGENGLTHVVGIKDKPFEILESAGGADEEARLVNLGVAEYVGEEPRKEEKPSEETPDETPDETPEEDIPEIPDENPDEEPKTKKKATTKRR